MQAAQELLAGTGWLPEPLRTPGQVTAATSTDLETLTEGEQAEADEIETEGEGADRHWQAAAE